MNCMKNVINGISKIQSLYLKTRMDNIQKKLFALFAWFAVEKKNEAKRNVEKIDIPPSKKTFVVIRVHSCLNYIAFENC